MHTAILNAWSHREIGMASLALSDKEGLRTRCREVLTDIHHRSKLNLHVHGVEAPVPCADLLRKVDGDKMKLGRFMAHTLVKRMPVLDMDGCDFEDLTEGQKRALESARISYAPGG